MRRSNTTVLILLLGLPLWLPAENALRVPPNSSAVHCREALLDDDVSITDPVLLMERIQKGDRAAFTFLHNLLARPILSYCIKVMGNETDGRDLYQEVWFKVFQKSHSYKSPLRVEPWIYSIAFHQGIDMFRRRGREGSRNVSLQSTSDSEDGGTLAELLIGQFDSPGSAAEIQELQEAVMATLERLSEDHRKILGLRFFGGYGYREIAEIIDIPIGTVKSRISGAKAAFRACFNRR